MGGAALILNQHAGQLGGDRLIQGRLVFKGDPGQVHFRAAVALALFIGFFQGVENAHQLTGMPLGVGGALFCGRRVGVLIVVITTCQQCCCEQEHKCHAHGIAFSGNSGCGHLTAVALPFATMDLAGY